MPTQLRWCRGVLTVACMILLATGQHSLLSLLGAQQDTNAKLTGTILDPHGNAVPNASVQVKSESSSLVRRTTAGLEGRFSAEGLPNGAYTVEVSAPGFSTSSRNASMSPSRIRAIHAISGSRFSP